jgi:hypothetical protein
MYYTILLLLSSHFGAENISLALFGNVKKYHFDCPSTSTCVVTRALLSIFSTIEFFENRANKNFVPADIFGLHLFSDFTMLDTSNYHLKVGHMIRLCQKSLISKRCW